MLCLEVGNMKAKKTSWFSISTRCKISVAFRLNPILRGVAGKAVGGLRSASIDCFRHPTYAPRISVMPAAAFSNHVSDKSLPRFLGAEKIFVSLDCPYP